MIFNQSPWYNHTAATHSRMTKTKLEFMFYCKIPDPQRRERQMCETEEQQVLVVFKWKMSMRKLLQTG